MPAVEGGMLTAMQWRCPAGSIPPAAGAASGQSTARRWQLREGQMSTSQLPVWLQLYTSLFPGHHMVYLLEKQGGCRQSSCDSMRIYFFLIKDQWSCKQRWMFAFIIPACEIITAGIHSRRGPIDWWKNFQGQWLTMICYFQEPSRTLNHSKCPCVISITHMLVYIGITILLFLGGDL